MDSIVCIPDLKVIHKSPLVEYTLPYGYSYDKIARI